MPATLHIAPGELTKWQLYSMMSATRLQWVKYGTEEQFTLRAIEREDGSGSRFILHVQYRHGAVGTMFVRTVD